MGFLNIFKNKKKEKKISKPALRGEQANRPKEPAKRTEAAKETAQVKPPVARKLKKRADGRAGLVLLSPRVTEKATALLDKNQYIFKVSQQSNKQEIKKAIEDVYDVEVIKVRVLNIKGKKRRLGRTMGWQKGYRKAMVKLKQDQKIEILPR